ncbi:MAG: hypothetical protein U9N86_01470 [Bacteroidota bacterium]|nr:hypothetical protein [Bacteroidota bacterium]
MKKTILILLAVALFGNACQEEPTPASLNKIRLSWSDDPATTMTIGWDQVDGEALNVYSCSGHTY